MPENSEQEQKQASQNNENNPQWNGATNEEVYTAEQRKRHLEQLEWSKQEVAKKESLLIETYKKMAEHDASVLQELYDKDPKITNRIAQEFWYDDYNDLKSIMIDTDETKDKWLSEDDLEKWYQNRRKKDEHLDAIKKATKELSKLPEEVREKAQEYFDDMIEWKTLTDEKAMNYLNMVTLYLNKDKLKDDKYANVIADAMSTGIWKWKSNTTDKVSKETLDMAKNLWFDKYFD